MKLWHQFLPILRLIILLSQVNHVSLLPIWPYLFHCDIDQPPKDVANSKSDAYQNDAFWNQLETRYKNLPEVDLIKSKVKSNWDGEGKGDKAL